MMVARENQAPLQRVNLGDCEMKDKHSEPLHCFVLVATSITGSIILAQRVTCKDADRHLEKSLPSPGQYQKGNLLIEMF
jgi:hypothetical protein